MAKKVATRSKTQLLKDQKALTAKIARANKDIRAILDEAGLMIETPTLRIFFTDAEGRRTGGDLIKCATLVSMCSNLRAGTVIMPVPTIRPKPPAPQAPQ